MIAFYNITQRYPYQVLTATNTDDTVKNRKVYNNKEDSQSEIWWFIMKRKLTLLIPITLLTINCGGPPGPDYLKINKYDNYVEFISNYNEHFSDVADYDYFLFNLDDVFLNNYSRCYQIVGLTDKYVCDVSLEHCNELYQIFALSLSFYDGGNFPVLEIFYQEYKDYNLENVSWFIGSHDYYIPLNSSNYESLKYDDSNESPYLNLMDSVTGYKLVTIERYNFKECFTSDKQFISFITLIEEAAIASLV